MMRALHADPADNVVVAVQPVRAGDVLSVEQELVVTASEEIPMGHKIALRDIPAGEAVIKYGVPIGRASQDIPRGAHVHIHNIEDITEELCKEYDAEYRRRAGAK